MERLLQHTRQSQRIDSGVVLQTDGAGQQTDRQTNTQFEVYELCRSCFSCAAAVKDNPRWSHSRE
jgi:hypothetical protein